MHWENICSVYENEIGILSELSIKDKINSISSFENKIQISMQKFDRKRRSNNLSYATTIFNYDLLQLIYTEIHYHNYNWLVVN